MLEYHFYAPYLEFSLKTSVQGYLYIAILRLDVYKYLLYLGDGGSVVEHRDFHD